MQITYTPAYKHILCTWNSQQLNEIFSRWCDPNGNLASGDVVGGGLRCLFSPFTKSSPLVTP